MIFSIIALQSFENNNKKVSFSPVKMSFLLSFVIFVILRPKFFRHSIHLSGYLFKIPVIHACFGYID